MGHKDDGHRRREQQRGCVMCGKKGCDRTQHSYSICQCGSAYCNAGCAPKKPAGNIGSFRRGGGRGRW